MTEDTKRINIEVRTGLWKQFRVRCVMQSKTLIQGVDEAIRLYLRTKKDDLLEED